MDKLSYGEKIRKLRREKGWDQTQLANLVGLAQSGISHIERCRRPLDSDMIAKLAKVFNVPESYFFSDEQEVKDKKSVTYALLRKLVEERYIDDIDNIDKYTMDLIINMVKTDLRQIIKDTK